MNKIDAAYVLVWAKKIMAANMLGGRCEKCGIDDPVLLVFHHPSDNKECNISQLAKYRWSILKEEVVKCSLLCQNCHGEVHKIVTPRYEKIREQLRNIKGNECVRCGYGGSGGLDFHHHDEKNKNFEIGDAVVHKVDWRLILEELDKCEVLCRNCHISEHFDHNRFSLFLDAIKQKVIGYKECPQPVDRAMVGELIKAGHSGYKIANMLGCSRSTISYIKKQI